MVAVAVGDVPFTSSVDSHLPIDLRCHVGIEPMNEAVEDDHNVRDLFDSFAVVIVDCELHDQFGHLLVSSGGYGNVAAGFTEGFGDPFVDGGLRLDRPHTNLPSIKTGEGGAETREFVLRPLRQGTLGKNFHLRHVFVRRVDEREAGANFKISLSLRAPFEPLLGDAKIAARLHLLRHLRLPDCRIRG